MTLNEKRRYLEDHEKPSLPYVVEFHDGRKGEAVNPLYLMDLIIHPDFSDIDDIETMYFMCVEHLKNIAGTFLAFKGLRATVYDGVGPFYDNAISRREDELTEEVQLVFSNPESPAILDGWDPWTVVASLIKIGYLKVFEKYPTWSEEEKKQGCSGCIFRKEDSGESFCTLWESVEAITYWDKSCPYVTNGECLDDYQEVEEVSAPTYKKEWVPTEKRTKEYAAFRIAK